MRVEERDGGLLVWAPAKLNLFLEVLARRPDGFHEIETLMCPIDLWDALSFHDDARGAISLSIDVVPPAAQPGAELPPDGGANLVVRALELLRTRTGISRGARVHLTKRIPLAAGLAGGSSDAAAALLAGNLGWKLGLDTAELAEMAAELGSDIPFFLGNGPAICRGRGERIEPLPCRGLMHAVVVKPPVGLATAAVYRACRAADAPRRVGPLVDALRHGRPEAIGRHLHNGLQAPAERLEPAIGRLRDEFARADVVAHHLTGSGTAYFALCRNEPHARQVAGRLRARNVGSASVVRVHC